MSNLSDKINKLIEDKAYEKMQERIDLTNKRYEYECSLFKKESIENMKKINKGRNEMTLYDPNSAEIKMYKAYEWICDHVTLKSNIEKNGNEFILKFIPHIDVEEQMDDFLKERFYEIYKNVKIKTNYLVA